MNFKETSEQKIEVRCIQCNKKLAEGIYKYLSIKCPRCKTLNNLKVDL